MSKRGRPRHPDILTPREWEVLALLREDLTNDEIAQRLGISLAGAKYHVSEILSKLGVASREEAARWEPPERPWWAGAGAPMAWLWRRATVSWLWTGAAGLAAILIVAGIGLLVWGLVRTDGDESVRGTWEELLNQMPASAQDDYLIMMNDYERIRAQVGISTLPPDADDEALEEYLSGLADELGAGVYEALGPPLLDSFFFPAGWRDEVGFTFADVDAADWAGVPGNEHVVLRGRFDEDSIDRAVRNDPVWSPLVTERSHHGVAYYSWGEDNSFDAERQTAVRPLGNAARIALNDDYIYWTTATDPMEEIIETGAGRERSLADIDELRQLARGLDRLGTYTAIFSDYNSPLSRFAINSDVPERRRPGLESILEKLSREPLLLPYTAVATGAGVDDEGFFMAIIVLHESDDYAQENVERLAQRIQQTDSWLNGEPWSDEIDLGGSEIISDGRLLLAKLRIETPGLALRIVLTRDGLLLYDDEP